MISGNIVRKCVELHPQLQCFEYTN